MKTLYVFISDVELREFDVPDEAVPLSIGGVCPAGCKHKRFEGQVFDTAIVTQMDYVKRTYRCEGGGEHKMPHLIAEVDHNGHVRVGTPNSFGEL